MTVDPYHRPPAAGPLLRRASSRRGGVLAAVAVVLLVAGGLGALVAVRHGQDAPSRSYVALYLTDAPVGLDQVTLTLAAAYAADRPLELKAPSVPISNLHGVPGAMLVADGFLPHTTSGHGFLVLSSIQGVRDGKTVEIRLRQPVLAVDNLVASGGFHRHAAVIDLDLERSLGTAPDGTLEFLPQLHALYEVRDASAGAFAVPELVARAQPRSVTEVHAYGSDDLPSSLHDRLCRGPTATSLSCPSHAVTCTSTCQAPTPAPRETLPSAPAEEPVAPDVNEPPTVDQPFPGDHIEIWGRRPTVTWTASDPEGDALHFRVMVGPADGTLTAACDGIAATGCALAPTGGALQDGASYDWRVDVKDETHAYVKGPVWRFLVHNQGPVPVTRAWPAPGASGVNSTDLLSWTPVVDPDQSDHVSYSVHMRLHGPSGTWSESPWSARTEFDPDLLGGSEYDWFVEAKDDVTVVASATWTFSTHTGL